MADEEQQRRGDADLTGWPARPVIDEINTAIWLSDAARHLAVVSFSAGPAQGRVGLGWTDLRGRGRTLTDLLDDRVFDRNGDEPADHGLFVDLPRGAAICWL